MPAVRSAKRVRAKAIANDRDGLSVAERGRRHLNGHVPVGLTSTTTPAPAGIAAHDPDALPGIRFRGDIVGPKCPPSEHGLIVDDEIRDLIEPLTPHERVTLKINIERDGCLDPLKGWKETGLLLDGHNRKEICEAHRPEPIPFAVEWLSFPDRQAAIAWVLGHQLGRRNITDQHRAYLIGKRLEQESKAHGGDRKSSRQPDDLKGRAQHRIAKEARVSPKTVERNGRFSKAVDRLANYESTLKPRLLSGAVKMSQGAAKAVTDLPVVKVDGIARAAKKCGSVDEALKKAGASVARPAKKGKADCLDPTHALVRSDPEAWHTLVNRLRELRGLCHNFKAGLKPVKKLVQEILTFAEANVIE